MHSCPITNRWETGCEFISSQTLSLRVEVPILGVTSHLACISVSISLHIYALLCIRIITYVNISRVYLEAEYDCTLICGIQDYGNIDK